jgi:hypothetical protein
MAKKRAKKTRKPGSGTIRVEHLIATLERIELECKLIREVLSLQKPNTVLARKPVRTTLGEEMEGGRYWVHIGPPRIAYNICKSALEIRQIPAPTRMAPKPRQASGIC